MRHKPSRRQSACSCRFAAPKRRSTIMHVSLDAEQWAVSDDTSLLEVLAQVSNKAQDRRRIVTSLKIGGRAHSDRDLVPALLARTARESGPVEALSSAT